MSTKTYFKRIALVVALSLGFGIAPATISSAVVTDQVLTISSATSTVAQGETATTTITPQFMSNAAKDSLLIQASCAASSGGTCPTIAFYWTKTADSNTGTQVSTDANGTAWADGTHQNSSSFGLGWSNNAGGVVGTARLVVNAKAVFTTSANTGTYTYTIYTTRYETVSGTHGAQARDAAKDKSVTWTVTVTSEAKTPASLTTYLAPTQMQALYWKQFPGGVNASSKDSAVTKATVASEASAPLAAAYVYANALNASGETITALGTNICGASGCVVTAEVTGPGLIAVGASGTHGGAPTATAATKSASMYVFNTAAPTDSREMLVVYSDGTAGTSTIKFYGTGRVLLATNTVTFTGTPGSAVITGISDSSSAVGNMETVTAIIRDSGLNRLASGTVYVFASDTKVVSVGANSTAAAQYTQLAAGVRGSTAGACSTYNNTTTLSCQITIGDTGTATIVLRDSWTVAASSWVSNEITVTGHGNTAASWKIAFDKTSYNAGESAILTITGTDLAGRAVSNGTAGSGISMGTVTTSLTFGNNGTTTAGTNGSGVTASSATFKGYAAGTALTGVETRVVVMPATSGTLTYTVKYTPANSTTETTASASVTVIDPAAVAAANAQAAADAATDAALQAIDAANAATDAANLSAEAADAATVAAQEAKDAADAATAAVESLATQVATLMAALQAQITSLANVVAKIAKKVKA